MGILESSLESDCNFFNSPSFRNGLNIGKSLFPAPGAPFLTFTQLANRSLRWSFFVGHQVLLILHKLFIKCPITKLKVFTGLKFPEHADLSGLKKIKTDCPHCGKNHTWNGDKVFFEDEP